MEIDEDAFLAMIRTISEPMFVIIPDKVMPDEDIVRVYKSLDEFLAKIEEKAKVKFDILIESAIYFNGYKEMSDIAKEQDE